MHEGPEPESQPSAPEERDYAAEDAAALRRMRERVQSGHYKPREAAHIEAARDNQEMVRAQTEWERQQGKHPDRLRQREDRQQRTGERGRGEPGQEHGGANGERGRGRGREHER
ncbi:MAG: hypothetical protein ACREHV_14285 [Rhizomicrobium sp.]